MCVIFLCKKQENVSVWILDDQIKGFVPVTISSYSEQSDVAQLVNTF